MNLVGIDIGGTFTDLVGCIDGRIVTSKSSAVPADPTHGLASFLPRLRGGAEHELFVRKLVTVMYAKQPTDPLR